MKKKNPNGVLDDLAKGFDKTKLNQRMDNLASTKFGDPKNPTFYMPGVDGKMHNVAKIDLDKMNPTNWEAKDKVIREYNLSLTNLDEDYTNQEPLDGVIVRCFHLVSEQSNGIYMPITVPVRVMTQNGMGTLETRDSKWGYSRKAVVVSVSAAYNSSLLSVGDFVELNQVAVLAEQRTKNDPMVLPFSYTLSEWQHVEPPTDLKNKHYGYLKLPLNLITTKLKKND